ncbi:hypothetical protein [Pseudolysinimonas sp.]|uniref:hypothetical protein n=1 Tax=Pseudolysinimonas sp. TaxID=2680009 RepID=UPI00286D1D57|nr:hypothetical protein [Pseudolysinimonas sp.]
MVRPFLSLLVAAVATVTGFALSWIGASTHAALVARLEPDPVGLALGIVGALVLGIAALSVAIHWVGALVVGAIHGLLGLLALVVPFGNPFAGGIFSPVFQITRMLSKVDPALGDGATMFYFSGTALVVGAFLIGAALGIRSRRLAGPSGAKAVAVSSSLSAGTLLGASALLLIAGGTFAQQIFQLLRYDAVSASIAVVAGVFAGLAGLMLRWSSIGVILPATVVFVAGVVLFAGLLPLPPSFPGRLPAAYGLVMVAGATFLGSAIGGVVRGRPEAVVDPDALSPPVAL